MQYLTNIGFFKSSDFSFGNALEFDGSNDYVDCSAGARLGATSTLTYSLWVKPSNIISGSYCLVSTGVGGQYYTAIFLSPDLVGTGGMRVLARNASTGHIDFPNAITTTDWSHILVVYDGAQTGVDRLKLYVNGSSVSGNLVSPDPAASLSGTVTSNLTLGMSIINNSLNYYGVMDELAIWVGYAGNQAEAQALSQGVDAESVIPNAKAYFHFNESGTNTIAADSTGNGFDGTLNGFTTPPDYWVAH